LAQSFLLFWSCVYRAFFRKSKGRQLPLQLQEAFLHAIRVPFTCAHFLHHRGGAHRIASANCGYMACTQNLFASAAQPQPRAPMRRTSDAPHEACFHATLLPRERAGNKTARGHCPHNKARGVVCAVAQRCRADDRRPQCPASPHHVAHELNL